ncbi:hypothetical protein [Gemmata palustris]|nr:hypothetical protein [Gemmata palustris]
MLALIRSEWFTVTLKRAGWCFHHSNEAALRVLQVGPLVIELA